VIKKICEPVKKNNLRAYEIIILQAREINSLKAYEMNNFRTCKISNLGHMK
jgi:hypothetical protein